MATTLVTTPQKNGEIHVSFSQSAATATDALVAAPDAGSRVDITEFVSGISVDGTATFFGGAADAALSGAIPVAAIGGIALHGSPRRPVFECAKGVAFSVTSVTGALRGFLKYRIVPA